MGASDLFGRTCRLTISTPVSTPGDFSSTTSDVLTINGGDDPALPSMRVAFKIEKTRQKQPNAAEFTVSNLASTTRAGLQAKGVKVQFEAGYLGTGIARFFIGDVRTVDHARQGPTWETKLRAGDSERSYRFARANGSFAAGTSANDVLKYLANQAGVPVGHVSLDFQSVATFDQGYTVSGTVNEAIDRLVKSLGFSWSFQDGALQVLAQGEALTVAIPQITPDTGLVGSPEMGTPEKRGAPALVKFRSLLIPVAPGAVVNLQSARYSGNVVVKKATFLGDTMGGDWYTDIEGVIKP